LSPTLALRIQSPNPTKNSLGGDGWILRMDKERGAGRRNIAEREAATYGES